MKSSIVLPSNMGLTDAQQDCVDVLEQVLEQARDGKINSLAVVVCMLDGYATTMCGKQAGDLNLGLDSLKKKILSEIERPRIIS